MKRIIVNDIIKNWINSVYITENLTGSTLEATADIEEEGGKVKITISGSVFEEILGDEIDEVSRERGLVLVGQLYYAIAERLRHDKELQVDGLDAFTTKSRSLVIHATRASLDAKCEFHFLILKVQDWVNSITLDPELTQSIAATDMLGRVADTCVFHDPDTLDIHITGAIFASDVAKSPWWKFHLSRLFYILADHYDNERTYKILNPIIKDNKMIYRSRRVEPKEANDDIRTALAKLAHRKVTLWRKMVRVNKGSSFRATSMSTAVQYPNSMPNVWKLRVYGDVFDSLLYATDNDEEYFNALLVGCLYSALSKNITEVWGCFVDFFEGFESCEAFTNPTIYFAE